MLIAKEEFFPELGREPKLFSCKISTLPDDGADWSAAVWPGSLVPTGGWASERRRDRWPRVNVVSQVTGGARSAQIWDQLGPIWVEAGRPGSEQ
jgi:hypothetical protein